MEKKYVFVYIYTIWIPPVAGLRHSSYSVADPWIQSWHLEMLSPEAPLQLLVFRPTDTHTHKHKLQLPPPVAGLWAFRLFSSWSLDPQLPHTETQTSLSGSWSRVVTLPLPDLQTPPQSPQ